MKIKKIKIAAVAIIMLFSLSVNSFAYEASSWYCPRNKEHKQPIFSADLSYVDKYNGYYIDKVHNDDSCEKVVYLTFDAGYENGNVAKILDVMKKQNVSGAFFVLGNLIEKNGDLIKRMVDEGHLVCNHTYYHKDMTKISESAAFSAELDKLNDAYYNLIGEEMPKFYRPPEGKFSEQNLKFASDAGYKTIFWSFAYADWDNDKQMSEEAAYNKIMDNIHNGAVILLHPTSETNAKILEKVIVNLKSEGYSFGSLYDLTL